MPSIFVSVSASQTFYFFVCLPSPPLSFPPLSFSHFPSPPSSFHFALPQFLLPLRLPLFLIEISRSGHSLCATLFPLLFSSHFVSILVFSFSYAPSLSPNSLVPFPLLLSPAFLTLLFSFSRVHNAGVCLPLFVYLLLPPCRFLAHFMFIRQTRIISCVCFPLYPFEVLVDTLSPPFSFTFCTVH